MAHAQSRPAPSRLLLRLFGPKQKTRRALAAGLLHGDENGDARFSERIVLKTGKHVTRARTPLMTNRYMQNRRGWYRARPPPIFLPGSGKHPSGVSGATLGPVGFRLSVADGARARACVHATTGTRVFHAAAAAAATAIGHRRDCRRREEQR